MRILSVASSALLMMILAACSTEAPRFYTLVPPASSASPVEDRAPYLIELVPVTVPAQVDIPQLVVRRGDGEVGMVEAEQWIAPLGNEMRDALLGVLLPELHTEDVYNLPAPDQGEVYRIKVDIRRFDSLLDRQVELQASWTAGLRTSGAELLTCGFSTRVAVGKGYGALVGGHQKAVQALAMQIAEGVRRLESGAAHCPQS
jgi:uncharacterized lipoprotein YmbA